MKNTKMWLSIFFGVQLSFATIWCDEMKKNVTLTAIQDDKVYLNLAEILNESEDVSTSLYLYNQLIKKKETNHCYDSNYVEALYRASHIYSFVDPQISLQLTEKIKIHDKNIPKWEIVDGYLVTDKMVPEMIGEDEKLFFIKMFTLSGLCDSKDDIEFTNDQIKIKLKPCCSCRQNILN